VAPLDPHLPAHQIAAPELPSHEARDEARIGLYVHVPFCAVSCTYCDFSKGRLSLAAQERYLAALEREARDRARDARGVRFTSVFLGGGTPSALAPHAFARLWSALRGAFELEPGAEITLEANPESVGPRRLAAWAAAGVNRLSMGAQSFDSAELRMLGRMHDPERVGKAVWLARSSGFRRLSVDLMFGFPDHDAARWSRTLDRALELEVEHLSAYCFTAEPGTPLGEEIRMERRALPDDAVQANLYAMLVERAERAGLVPYETSNFARPRGEARHNLTYWLVRPSLGLGPSAHGLWRGARHANHRSLSRWATAIEHGAGAVAEIELPDPRRHAREVMMLGLRLATGLDAHDHAPEVWRSLVAVYGDALARGVARGRLEQVDESLRIPAAHRFVADDVIAWIEARASRSGVDSATSGFLTSVVPCPKP